MTPLTTREATRQYRSCWTKFDSTRQGFEDCLSATENLIVACQANIRQKIHDEELLSRDEAQDLATILSEVTDKFFPGPERTLVDDADSVEAHVIRLSPSSIKLKNFRSALAGARYEVAILVDWYDWFSREVKHDAGGMFDAIRHQHDLLRIFDERLGKVAGTLHKLREE